MVRLFRSLSEVQTNLDFYKKPKSMLGNQKREQKRMSYVPCEFELKLFLNRNSTVVLISQ